MRLQDTALAPFTLQHEVTGQPTEKPAHQLGHATIRFAIALEALADAGEAAMFASEARFEPNHPPGDELAGERAQLALLSAIAAGDFALDAFAWAELVRRGWLLTRKADGRIPVLWSKLMVELDAAPNDQMVGM